MPHVACEPQESTLSLAVSAQGVGPVRQALRPRGGDSQWKQLTKGTRTVAARTSDPQHCAHARGQHGPPRGAPRAPLRPGPGVSPTPRAPCGPGPCPQGAPRSICLTPVLATAGLWLKRRCLRGVPCAPTRAAACPETRAVGATWLPSLFTLGPFCVLCCTRGVLRVGTASQPLAGSGHPSAVLQPCRAADHRPVLTAELV